MHVYVCNPHWHAQISKKSRLVRAVWQSILKKFRNLKKIQSALNVEPNQRTLKKIFVVRFWDQLNFDLFKADKIRCHYLAEILPIRRKTLSNQSIVPL